MDSGMRKALMAGIAVLVFASTAGASEALWSAASDGNLAALQKLKPGTDWNAADTEGETALIKAVAREQDDVVRFLLKKKVQVDRRDKAGNTALLYAVSQNRLDMVKTLVAAGASVSLSYPPKNENALFEAVRVGAGGIVDFLLQKNAKLLDHANVDGLTPVFVAVESMQSGIALKLIERGASVSRRTKSGQTLLETARGANHKEDSPLVRKLKTPAK